MITPTGATIAQYWQAIKDGCVQHCRMTFDNNIVLDDSDINQSGMELMDIINGATDLTIGAAVMKTLSMKLFVNNKTRNIVWGSEFVLEFGVEINGTTNWITVGTFTGERPDQYPVNDIFEVSACDRMQKFDIVADDFLSNITYPITFGNMYHDLCTFVGVQYDAGDELANIMSRSFTASPLASGMTCRDILGLMAEACGCYAKITPAGHVKMVWFADASSYSVPADEEFRLSAMNIERGRTWEWMEQYTWEDLESMTWDEIAKYNDAMTIDALSVKSSNDDIGVIVPSSGTRKNVYYIIDNPFLFTETDQDVEDYIEPIYTRLNAFGSYLPMNVECTGNWLVESGDIITVDFKGESIKLPIFARTLQWRGSCKDTYEATGRLQRDSMSVPTHDKLSQMGRFHEIKVTIDGNYEKIQDQFGNYYTKTETATEISLAVSSVIPEFDPNHSYSVGDFCSYESKIYEFTSAHSGAWDINDVVLSDVTAYVDQNAYIRQSGIDINASGVNVTGSKYVRITAATNTYWEYNQNGLEYYTSGVNRPLIRFGARLTGTSIPSVNCGVFEFNDGDTTAGKMALVAMNHSQNKYDYFLIKLASVNSDLEMSLLPSGSTKAFLGSSSNDFRGLYVRNIYGTNSVGELNVFTKPSGTKGFSLWEASNSNDVYISTYQYVHAPQAVTSVVVYGRTITPSSRYVKKNIKKIECNDTIDKLTPVSFEYKGDKVRHNGLIYEDTIDIMPEICNCDEMGRKGINYVELVPVLLKEIQNLRKRLEEVEKKVVKE